MLFSNPPSSDELIRELECYKGRCRELEAEVQMLKTENAKMREELAAVKTTYGNQFEEGARTHAVLMTIKETCNLRGENFFDYSMAYLDQTSRS